MQVHENSLTCDKDQEHLLCKMGLCLAGALLSSFCFSNQVEMTVLKFQDKEKAQVQAGNGFVKEEVQPKTWSR